MQALTNENLISKVRSLVKEERRVTREILDHINEVERRRLYVDLGFTSTYDWLVKDLGYSGSAAYRRLSAARLLCAVPALAEKIESGRVNLTTLAQAQTAIRSEERRSGERLPLERKSSVVASIESKSSRETENELIQIFPSLESPRSEKIRPCSGGEVRLEVRLSAQQMQKVERVRELLSHSNCSASIAEILEVVVDEFLNRKDPLLRSTRSPSTTHSGTGSGNGIAARVPSSLRRQILKRDHARCQYRDSRTGRTCESRYQIEVDHVIPRALGGTDTPGNLRALCRVHNQKSADEWFGFKLMDEFRRAHSRYHT